MALHSYDKIIAFVNAIYNKPPDLRWIYSESQKHKDEVNTSLLDKARS